MMQPERPPLAVAALRGASGRLVAAIAAGLLAGLLAAPAAATVARVEALGGLGGYLEDQSNVLPWYGSLLDYPDLAVLELGDYDLEGHPDLREQQASDQGASFHARLDQRRRWGVLAAYLESLPGLPRDGVRLTGLYGRTFGPVGAVVTFGGTSYQESRDRDEEPYEARWNYHHVAGAGLRWSLSERLYADLAGEVINTQFGYQDNGREILFDGGSTWESFGVRARAFWGPDERVALVPLFEHLEQHRPTYSLDLEDVADLDSRLTRVGLGVNLLLDADNLLVFSAEYRDVESDQIGPGNLGALYDQSLEDHYSVGVRFGVESRVLSWLTGRAAARYLRFQGTVLQRRFPVEGVTDPALRYDFDVRADVALSLGLALHLGRFEADFVVNDDAPFNLGGLVTNAGEEGESAQFTRVSLLYSF